MCLTKKSVLLLFSFVCLLPTARGDDLTELIENPLLRKKAGSLSETEQRKADARLEFMSKHARGYVGECERTKAKIKSLEHPVLRWQNLHNKTMDGTLLVWVDDVGRPRAAAQMFWFPRTAGRYGVEFQSLWDGPMTFESPDDPAWSPRAPGLDWKPFPDKPQPVKSPKLRLSQMRRLARRFRGDDRFYREDNALRLMTNPMIRYSVPKEGLLDGAMFALCLGTDPEMLIMIEARQDMETKTESYRWALAPMTTWPLKGFLDGELVWDKPQVRDNKPSNIFFVCDLKGSPPEISRSSN